MDTTTKTHGTFTKGDRTVTATSAAQAVRLAYDGWRQTDLDTTPEADVAGPPPKAGAGSGKQAWAEYAAAHDIAVDDDASRDDIVAAVQAAGVPTE